MNRRLVIWLLAATVLAAAAVIVWLVVLRPSGPEFSRMRGFWRNPTGYAGKPIEYHVGRRTITVIRGMHVGHYRLRRIVEKGRRLIIHLYSIELRRDATYTVEVIDPDTVILHLSLQKIRLKRVK
ncbi:MAG: hypothetical protein KJ621_07750 [Proteobacteria bacterium]|nr:hypothetical protein [Pseudomonadota bacterium]MBU1740220.1 hypothetical protein [Pseudomonadota bacterium]